MFVAVDWGSCGVVCVGEVVSLGSFGVVCVFVAVALGFCDLVGGVV